MAARDVTNIFFIKELEKLVVAEFSRVAWIDGIFFLQHRFECRVEYTIAYLLNPAFKWGITRWAQLVTHIETNTSNVVSFIEFIYLILAIKENSDCV